MGPQPQDGKKSLPLLAISVVLYALAAWLSLELSQRYAIPSDHPGGDPPWYFIRRDAIQGICFLLYFLVCLAIGAWASWKKMGNGVTMIWFSLTWASSSIWTLGLILLRSDNIFDLQKARTSWPTFYSYHGDPLRWGWLLILLAVGIVIAISRHRERQREPADR